MMEEADERCSMSHDSGFRRNDHDSTHGPAVRKQPRSKASAEFEARMKKRHEHHERLRKLLAERKQTATDS
jgi:hypothetical protein